MLKKASYIIAKKIDNGQYFKDSFEWFAVKHLHIIALQRMMLISTFILICSLACIVAVSQMTFSVKSYPFPVFALDEVNYFPVIKPISKEKESINISVARYLAGNYVSLREEYKFSEQSDDLKNIHDQKLRNLSSLRVYRGYLNSMDPDFNFNSPLILYKNHTQRNIEILNVQLGGSVLRPDSAVVNYKTIEKGIFGEKSFQYKATIDFNMNDVEKIFKKQSPLSFVVTNYKTEKVSQANAE